MTERPEDQRLRERIARLEADLESRLQGPESGTARMLVMVLDLGHKPDFTPAVFACSPAGATGIEQEGGGSDLMARTQVMFVTVLGAVPDAGDYLLARLIGGRWVAERGASAPETGHTVTGCPCHNIPDSIFLRVQNAPPPSVTRLVWPATITWQTKPADLHVYNIPSPGYFSDVFEGIGHLEDGTEYVASTFRYYFSCSLGLYVVSGLFIDGSPGGYPGSFPIMQWLIGLGFDGVFNACSPFNLPFGSPASLIIRNQGVSMDASGP